MNDPFASAPDEPQTAVEPTTVGTVKVRVEPDLTGFKDGISRVIPSEGKVVLTFKGGEGFDAPWIVIHATDLDDALDHVTGQGDTLIALMERVQSAGTVFKGKAPVSQNSNAAPQRQLQPGQPAGSVEAPSWAPPKPFDDFVYVTKVKAETGKTWHAWMPPEKGDSRQPKFFFPPR